MAKILETYEMDLKCPVCEMITQHNVQKIDEKDNGEFIGYWSECDICEHIDEHFKEDLFKS